MYQSASRHRLEFSPFRQFPFKLRATGSFESMAAVASLFAQLYDRSGSVFPRDTIVEALAQSAGPRGLLGPRDGRRKLGAAGSRGLDRERAAVSRGGASAAVAPRAAAEQA